MGLGDIIIIHKYNVLARSVLDSGVSGSSNILVLFTDNLPSLVLPPSPSEIFHNSDRFLVGRSVVDEDYFDVWVCLGFDGFNGLFKEGTSIVMDEYDGHEWLLV
jgi:hypothetical protein